jgi:hypothetical protein
VKCRRLENSPFLLIFASLTVLLELLVFGLLEVILLLGLAFLDCTS